jgi:hypothetical protein
MTGVHRRTPSGNPDARLDDLLEFAEPSAPATPPPDPWVLRAVMHAALASVVVAMGFVIFNLVPPYLVIVVVCGCAVLVRRGVQLTGEPQKNRTWEVVRPPGPVRSSEHVGWSYDGDGVRDAIRRWDRRLEWGGTAPERYRVSVAGRLVELAEERLRQARGITPAQDPERAREVLGAATWDLLYGSGRYASGEVTPSAAEVMAAVKRLESLAEPDSQLDPGMQEDRSTGARRGM